MAAAAAIASLALVDTAEAHVSVKDRVVAGQREVLSFGVGHGCNGADTVAIRIELPGGLTSVRAVPSVAFGEGIIERDAAGAAVAVSWSKTDARTTDDQYYVLALRAKMPDTPFEQLFFPTRQTCKDSTGTETVVEWSATTGHHHGGTGTGSPPSTRPAPSTFVTPPRHPGWNRYTLNEHVHDLSVFSDAQIVWSGNAAFSANPETLELIRDDTSVTELRALHPGATIEVLY